MTAVKMTAAQARRLGIDPSAGTPEPGADGGQRPRRRRCPPSPAECYDCGLRCDTEAAQRRHVDETHHARFQLILELETVVE